MFKKVKADGIYRIRIPIQMCRALNISPDQELNVLLEKEKIILTNSLNTMECLSCRETFSNNYAYCPYCGKEITCIPESNTNE